MNGTMYRINKLQYDSRIAVTNHNLCQTVSVAESRLPHVTRRGNPLLPYSRGIWQPTRKIAGLKRKITFCRGFVR